MPLQASASDRRTHELERWLDSTLRTPFAIEPLAADASFRRYFRVQLGERGTRVAMDAPPLHEDAAPFVHIAELLLELGLSAPRVEAADLANGFILLEDLGSTTYTRALAEGADEHALYALATDTLAVLHTRWHPGLGEEIPLYDEVALLDEASLLIDWYWPAVRGEACPAAVRDEFLAVWREVLGEAARLKPTLVLRDYHVDNLMVIDGRDGVAACGLLDFQDARIGSPAYDLVSLLRDARRDVPAALQREMLARYQAARPQLSPDDFETAYWILGAQRTTKVIGIFTRLDRRDHKPGYLVHMPRLWRLLAEELAHPALAPVCRWYERHLPQGLRTTPARSACAP
jgi:aminoglycoside/choline kinase family phosphotransferase